MSADSAQSLATRPVTEMAPDKSAGYPFKLSICLITYNRATYLEILLEELFKTRLFDFSFEIVLCDNHSTDRTPEVVAAWKAKHPEIRSVRQKFNVGHENNIACAYRLAKGEFCVYLADDDRLIPEAVAEFVRYMEARPNIAVCYAGKQTWDDHNKKPVGQHYLVPEERIFTKASAVELFNMCLQIEFILKFVFSVPSQCTGSTQYHSTCTVLMQIWPTFSNTAMSHSFPSRSIGKSLSA